MLTPILVFSVITIAMISIVIVFYKNQQIIKRYKRLARDLNCLDEEEFKTLTSRLKCNSRAEDYFRELESEDFQNWLKQHRDNCKISK